MTLEQMYHELNALVRVKYPEGIINVNANIAAYGDGFQKQLKVFIRQYSTSQPHIITTTSYAALHANVVDYLAGEQEEIEV